jgi:transcriptional regulator with XRE-family HTH domain
MDKVLKKAPIKRVLFYVDISHFQWHNKREKEGESYMTVSIFAKRIKALRLDNGKTQQDVAGTIGVLRSTYGEYERGKIMPPMDKINALAALYGVTVDYLIGNSNDPNQAVSSREMDVSDSMKQIIEYLQNEQSKLTFDGEILDDESRELLISSIESSLKLGKMISKRKG